MKITIRTRLGALGAVLALAGGGVFTGTAAAHASTAPASVTPVFDLNGKYSDGGSARPVISNVNDVLTIDMSSQHRPTATGIVVNSDTIVVTFPDDTTYAAKLLDPSTIKWSNGSLWQKTKVVPNVKGLTVAGAKSVLVANGFVLGSVGSFVDHLCNYIDVVGQQTPGAGASAIPGSAVNVKVGKLPPHPCP